jgi:hypothetical protein
VLQAGAHRSVVGGEDGAAAAALRHLFARDFAFADEFGGEAGGAAAFGGGAPQYKSVTAVFDDPAVAVLEIDIFDQFGLGVCSTAHRRRGGGSVLSAARHMHPRAASLSA